MMAVILCVVEIATIQPQRPQTCCKKCYIFVTTILTLHVVCDNIIHMYESF